jgi:nucleoid-associated protein YgaU
VKLLIGVLLLLVAFVAAAIWQTSWRAEARAERGLVRSGQQRTPPPKAQDEGWGRVIIGRPSGAEPVQPAEPPASPRFPKSAPEADPGHDPSKRAGDRLAPPGSEQPTAAALGDGHVVVQSGDTLSRLCQAHYGTSRPDVVQALAAYNGLKDADSLRAGQTLNLPNLERLLGKKP